MPRGGEKPDESLIITGPRLRKQTVKHTVNKLKTPANGQRPAKAKSLKIVRSKKTIKHKNNRSAPTSPANHDNTSLEQIASALASRLTINSATQQGTPINGSVNANVAKDSVRTKTSEALNNDANLSIIAVPSPTTNMASIDEEKEQMRQRIAQLEAQIEEKQKREEELRRQKERDEEYQALREKLQNLERRASQTNSPPIYNKPSKTDKHDNSDSKSGKVDINIESEPTKMPGLNEISELLHSAEKRVVKEKKAKKKRKTRHRHRSDSSDKSSSETSTDDSEDSSDEDNRKPHKGKKLTSGLYVKPGNVRLKSRESYAHAAIDDASGGDRDINTLSFNLLVAGELEIISNKEISEKERFTRIEVLKNLAYKHEHLSRSDIIKQYTNFLRKVEKGVFRWGSKSALRTFDQQLLYNVSLESKSKIKPQQKFKNDERKKYCLDYNRGNCSMGASHEGKLNGAQVFKLHVCRWCLVNENKEVKHPEKDCPQK